MRAQLQRKSAKSSEPARQAWRGRGGAQAAATAQLAGTLNQRPQVQAQFALQRMLDHRPAVVAQAKAADALSDRIAQREGADAVVQRIYLKDNRYSTDPPEWSDANQPPQGYTAHGVHNDGVHGVDILYIGPRKHPAVRAIGREQRRLLAEERARRHAAETTERAPLGEDY